MKQTAVEWLLENLINETFSEEDFKHNFNVWNKAKEMEKQQMWNYIETNYVIGENSLLFHKQEFEQYYNETFKKEKGL
jgi:HD superfamily phosphodiesterase